MIEPIYRLSDDVCENIPKLRRKIQFDYLSVTVQKNIRFQCYLPQMSSLKILGAIKSS